VTRRHPNRRIRIKREGYCVDPYTRKDGTRVKGYCTEPTSFLIQDPGRPGRDTRGAKAGPYKDDRAWIQREGKLGGPGYTRRSRSKRHALLDRCVGEYGYRSCQGSLQIILRNADVKADTRKVVEEDLAWLKDKYGGPGSYGPERRGNPHGGSFEIYELEELLAMPVLAETEAHELRVDDGTYRWWTSRMTPAEGEDYQVYVEQLVHAPDGARYVHVHAYAPFGAVGHGEQDEYATYYADGEGGTRALIHEEHAVARVPNQPLPSPRARKPRKSGNRKRGTSKPRRLSARDRERLKNQLTER